MYLMSQPIDQIKIHPNSTYISFFCHNWFNMFITTRFLYQLVTLFMHQQFTLNTLKSLSTQSPYSVMAVCTKGSLCTKKKVSQGAETRAAASTLYFFLFRCSNSCIVIVIVVLKYGNNISCIKWQRKEEKQKFNILQR